MNQINIIQPYNYNGALVFDDARTGLVQEPFVNGADLALRIAAQSLGVNPERFNLIFSKDRFPGYQFTAEWLRKGFEDDGVPDPLSGDWYKVRLGENEMDGWLCPALLKYFDAAPPMIYFQIQAV